MRRHVNPPFRVILREAQSGPNGRVILASAHVEEGSYWPSSPHRSPLHPACCRQVTTHPNRVVGKCRVNRGQGLVVGGYLPGPRGFDSLIVGYYDVIEFPCCQDS